MIVCSIEDCEKPVRARGWCTTHWQRWNRRGDPLLARPYPPKCEWISRDEEDRPSCVHGPADRSGGHWTCRNKAKLLNARRIMVMGELVHPPNMETRELMRQLRDDRKAAHG